MQDAGGSTQSPSNPQQGDGKQTNSAVAAAIISGVVALGSAIWNNQAQKKRNREQREWNEEMWEKQNVYDSPAETRKRLQQAGLNPALMYGQGSNWANSANPESYNPESPQSPIPPDLVPMIQETRQQEVGISKTQADISLSHSIANRQDADAIKAMTGADLNRSQTKQLDTLLGTQLKSQEMDVKLKNLKAMTEFNQELRNQTLHVHSVEELRAKAKNAMAQVANTRAELGLINARIDAVLESKLGTELDNQLKRRGFQPSDPLWQRMIGRFWSEIEGAYGQGKKMYNILNPTKQ